MSIREKTRKHSKKWISLVYAALYILLPISYFASGWLLTEIDSFGRKQLELTGVGTIEIPNKWSAVKSDDDFIDIIVFASASKAQEEGAIPILVCYKLDDYKNAVLANKVYGDLDHICSADYYRSGGLWNGVDLSKYEYYDIKTNTKSTYYKIIIHRNGTYIIFTTADSVKPITFLKIALSFWSA